MSTEAPLVGVLVDDSLRGWQIEALERMVDAGAEIALTVRNEMSGSRVWEVARRDSAYAPIAITRELSLRRHHPGLFANTAIEEVDRFDSATLVRCDPTPCDDYGETLPDEVVDRHCSNLDFLVRFGFGILRGSVLDAPRYGVLSYHHGDLREYRGRPAAFWEFMNDEPNVGVTLQQLTDEVDGGNIVAMGRVERKNGDQYADLFAKAYEESTGLLAQAVTDVRRDRFEPTEPGELGPVYTTPGWRTAGEFFLKSLRIWLG